MPQALLLSLDTDLRSMCLNVMYTLATDYNNIGKFLNRILGMAVQQQNALFQYFSDTLTAVIQEAKRNGRYDMGILGETVVFLIFIILFSLIQKVFVYFIQSIFLSGKSV